MNEKNVFILTGPVRTGKSTRLLEWTLTRENAEGIITPNSGNKRMFYNISNRELFPMEASPEEENILTVGKYIFSKSSFNKAEKIIEDGINNNVDWLIIDEIGPLELKGEGFNKILKKILVNDKKKFNLLLVIRDTKLIDVLNHFEIKQYQLIEI